MYRNIALVLGLGFAAGCGHPPPTDADVEAAIYQHMHAKLPMSPNRCVRGPTLKEITARSSSGDNSTATVAIECHVDDGSFGASCGNIMGCYVARELRCEVSLRWQNNGWQTAKVACK